MSEIGNVFLTSLFSLSASMVLFISSSFMATMASTPVPLAAGMETWWERSDRDWLDEWWLLLDLLVVSEPGADEQSVLGVFLN